ncbi:MAG: RHS repeat-associated core domain-containing protein, partial [Pseudomonadota bacterium]
FKTARNYQSTQQYNERNELKQNNQPDGGITTFGYDANGALQSVNDPVNAITNYAVSGFSEKASESTPDSSTRSATYDSAGNMLTYNNGRFTTNYVEYDALNRIKRIVHPTGPDTVYTYDTSQPGYLYHVTDDSGASTFEYNQAGEVVKRTIVVSGQTMTLEYQYDIGGRVAQMLMPGGTRLYYSYDAAGRVEKIEAQHPSFSRRDIVSGVEYKPFGPMSRMVFGDSRFHTSTRSLDYDVDYELEQIVSGNVLVKTYQHDANGNITRITDGLTNQVRNYDYDVMDRLDYHSGPDGTFNYTYDDNGNRKTRNSTSYNYFSTSNRLSSHSGTSLSWDSAGSMVTRYGNTYMDRDQRDRLYRSRPSNTRYYYNAFGERVYKLRGSFNQRFVYGSGARLLHERGSQGTIDYIYLNGEPIAIVRGGSIYNVHNDHLGRPEKLTNTLGQVAWSATPNAWSSDAPGGSIPFNLRFPGQYFDSESGFHYNYFRYYNPLTGRYLSADPIGLNGGLNRYAYAGNNPVNAIDPYGLSPYTPYTNPMTGRPYGDEPPLDWTGFDEYVSFCVGFTPASVYADLYVAVTGRDMFTGEEVTGVWRWAGVVPLVSEARKVSRLSTAVPNGGTARGLSRLGGVIEQTGTNAAGGRIFTSTGKISQRDFTGIVNSGVARGDDVHIFTGVHGAPTGSIVPDGALLLDDIEMFGDIPGVHIHDLSTISVDKAREILNGPGTIIGGFCDSGACLAPFGK